MPRPDPPTAVKGCTDPFATNFNPDATEDDGSCIFPPEGFLFEGEYSNNQGDNPIYNISTFSSGLDSLIKNSISIDTITPIGNRVSIIIDNVRMFSGGFHEINALTVRENRSGNWVEDASYVSDFQETTKVGVVFILKKSYSAAGETVFNMVKGFSLRLLELLKDNSNIEFYIALMAYGDVSSVLEPLDTILNESSFPKFEQKINELSNAPLEASVLGNTIMEAADLLKSFTKEIDHKGIFIFGDGVDNVAGDGLAGAIAKLELESIKDVFCVGVESDTFPFPTDGEENFANLAALGNSHFEKIDQIEKMEGIFQKYYKIIPNAYQLRYTRTKLRTINAIPLQWQIITTVKD